MRYIGKNIQFRHGRDIITFVARTRVFIIAVQLPFSPGRSALLIPIQSRLLIFLAIVLIKSLLSYRLTEPTTLLKTDYHQAGQLVFIVLNYLVSSRILTIERVSQGFLQRYISGLIVRVV